jgi:hypothetical protein
MNGVAMNQSAQAQLEAALREGLARGDAAFRGIASVLTHMLDDSWPSIVSDASLARVQGMMTGFAHELRSSAPGDNVLSEPDLEVFRQTLLSDERLLEHCFVLSVEGQIIDRLADEHSVERVLSPLLQELVGSDREEIAELAMSCITAQSRFVQTQSRMQTPLSDLPADLFHAVLGKWQEFASKHRKDVPIQSIEALRKNYDEGATRAAQLERLVASMGKGVRAAFDLPHAGFSMFATALARESDQSRSHAVLACQSVQSPRLALGLRATGLEEADIAKNVVALGGEATDSKGLNQILPDQAQSILNDTDAL